MRGQCRTSMDSARIESIGVSIYNDRPGHPSTSRRERKPDMMRRSTVPLLLLALPFLTAAPAFAQAKSKKDAAGEKKSEGKKQDPKKAEKKKGPTYELNTQGTLGAPAKGSPDVYEFAYVESDGKKPVKKQAW